MFMSHDAIDRCAKSRTTERGPPFAGAWHRAVRRGSSSVARFWIVAPASIPLPRRGGGDWASRSHHGTVGSHHVEDPRQHRARFAQLFGNERTDTWRDCRACHLDVPQGNTQAWLRAASAAIARFASTTRLIVCSPRNFSRSTRFWFLTAFAL